MPSTGIKGKTKEKSKKNPFSFPQTCFPLLIGCVLLLSCLSLEAQKINNPLSSTITAGTQKKI